MSKTKRAFLVSVLGEERTAAIERRLPEAEKALEEMGIGWKSDDVMLEVAPLPMGGATSFAEVDDWKKANDKRFEILDLTDIFSVVVSNILAADDLDTPAKSKLLEAAADDFGDRLSALGRKELAILEQRRPSLKALAAPATTTATVARLYLEDLLRSREAVELEAGKELGDGPEGPAGHISDLLRQGGVGARPLGDLPGRDN